MIWTLRIVVLCALILLVQRGYSEQTSYPLSVLPSEQKVMTDPETGVTLTFLTTDPGVDTNLYFHDRSWLADSSLIVFQSQRANGGLMGYLTKTGELVKLATPKGGLGGATAATKSNCIYAMRGDEVVELSLVIAPSSDSAKTPSQVTARERVLCTLPSSEHGTALNNSSDGARLAIGANANENHGPLIHVIRVDTGQIVRTCYIPESLSYAGHVQWSHTNPNLLSFAGLSERLQIIDVHTGGIRAPYAQLPGELVTHESWWVKDQMLFCGGVHPKPTEDSHVKVLNITTGEVRIIGAGAWWPDGTPEQISKLNWWHAAGSDDGAGVVADNWHGDIMLFDAHTTRPRLLTGGHRTYGKGEHPHVGWDRKGEQVVFTSHRLGNPNVCVATIPAAWRLH